MFLLRVDVPQHCIELARAHREGAITALPEKSAIASVKRFDPFRGYLLNLFDELSLGNSSRQRRRDNMNVISNAAYVHQIGTEIAAERRQISVYARPHLDIEPRLAILRAKNDMKDDFAKRLRHGANDDRTGVASESRF